MRIATRGAEAPRGRSDGDAGLGPVRAVVLAIIALCLFLPGFFSLPPTDRDEARFAQATRQMLQSGDYVDIRFQEEARYRKPVGIYWLQAAAVGLIGDPATAPIWAYRLPSLAGAVLAVLLSGMMGARLFGPQAGMLTGVMLAATLLLGVEARIAKTDAALLAAIVSAQAILGLAWMRRDCAQALPVRLTLAFWIAVSCGILLKGPILLLVSGGTAAALALGAWRGRWLLRLRPLTGLAVMAVCVAPWLILIAIRSDGAFFAEAVGHDMLAKVAGGQESKGFPPGYYLLAFPVTFWPWTALAIAAIPWVWANRRQDAVTFCLAWIVPSWIVFEAVPTKLLHYVLPTYPAIALLAAGAIADGWNHVPRWLRIAAAALTGVVGLALAGTISGLPVLVAERTDWIAISLAAVSLGGLGFAVVRLARGAPARSVPPFAVAALALYGSAYQQVLPSLDPIWLSPRIADALTAAGEGGGRRLATAGYAEPSLIFLTSADTFLAPDGATAARELVAGNYDLAAVEWAELGSFLAAAAVSGALPVAVAEIEGFNYSKGRRVRVTLFRR